jgi:hypothetical protein
MSSKHFILLFVFPILIMSVGCGIFWDTVAAYDIAGNVSGRPTSASDTTLAKTITILFEELFEDINFAQRGWYDVTGGILSSSEHIPGNTKSFECRFLQGGQRCNGGGPSRHLFPETDSVYISFWIKYSPNWTGSNKPYHPHQFYLLTNQNSQWVGPAWTRLTAYIEENEGTPLLLIQDGQNIDKTKIGRNLLNLTESRAVAGCNGDSDVHGNGDCYRCGSEYCNGKGWKAGGIYFSNSPGPYHKNDWHHIEAYFRLNSILNGKGLADGVVKYWFDNELIIDHSDVMMRTAQYPEMKFNQLLLAPWIGDGSPVDQTFWVDNLIVATGRIDTTSPAAPTGVLR